MPADGDILVSCSLVEIVEDDAWCVALECSSVEIEDSVVIGVVVKYCLSVVVNGDVISVKLIAVVVLDD